LIYSDHAGYSTTRSNLGDIDYDEIISNAKKAGYKVDVLVCHSSRNEYYSMIEQKDYSWKLLVGKLSAYNDISEGVWTGHNILEVPHLQMF